MFLLLIGMVTALGDVPVGPFVEVSSEVWLRTHPDEAASGARPGGGAPVALRVVGEYGEWLQVSTWVPGEGACDGWLDASPTVLQLWVRAEEVTSIESPCRPGKGSLPSAALGPDRFPTHTALTWPDGTPAGHLGYGARLPFHQPGGDRPCVEWTLPGDGTVAQRQLPVCLEAEERPSRAPYGFPPEALDGLERAVRERFPLIEAEPRKEVSPKRPREVATRYAVSCRITAFVNERGRPFHARSEECPGGFATNAGLAVLKWRWRPQFIEGRQGPFRVQVQVDYPAP